MKIDRLALGVAIAISIAWGFGNMDSGDLVGVWEGVVFQPGSCWNEALLIRVCEDLDLSVSGRGCPDSSRPILTDPCMGPKIDGFAGYGMRHFCPESLERNRRSDSPNPRLLAYQHYPPPWIKGGASRRYCLLTYELQFTRKTVYLDHVTYTYEVVEAGDNFIVLGLSGGDGKGRSRNLFITFKDGEDGLRYLSFEDGRQFVWNPELSKNVRF